MRLSDVKGDDTEAAMRYYRYHDEHGTLSGDKVHAILHLQDNPDELVRAIMKYNASKSPPKSPVTAPDPFQR